MSESQRSADFRLVNADEAANAVRQLTPGQLDCLRLVHLQLSSKEIAAELQISPHTVDQRIRQALQVLGVERRSQAAKIVTQLCGPYQRLIHQSAQLASSYLEPLAEQQPRRPQRGPGAGGAKLGRSETVTVRLDPKLNYLCELAARAQRRTKSSFIEWAIADSLKSVSLPEVIGYGDSYDEVRDVTLQEKASELWQVDETDRLVALALIAPALLKHEEQLIWRVIRENGYVWKGHYDKQGDWTWTVSEESLVRERLRDCWDTFKGVALGELPKDRLPTWPKRKLEKFSGELDDEVPF